MVNVRIPVILGIIVVAIFAICVLNGRRITEGFTTLIGTTNNSLSTVDKSVSGLYVPVDDKLKKYDYTPYNLSLLSKGNQVVIMINKVTPKSRLRELCNTDDDCETGKCDVTGLYNAKGRCVKSDASSSSTGPNNTVPTVRSQIIFYIKPNGGLFRYDTRTDTSRKLVSGADGFDAPSGYVAFYRKNGNLYRLEIDRYNESSVTTKKLGSSIKSGISAVNENFVYWVANNNHQIWKWDPGHGTVNIPSTNVKSVTGVSESCVWYISRDNAHLGKNEWTSSDGWVDHPYPHWHTIEEISPASSTICYYRCNGSYSSYEDLGCYKDESSRDLPHQLASHGLSIDKCREKCTDAGYKYSGRQYDGQCFCGDSYGKYGKTTGCDCNGSNVGAWKQCISKHNGSSCSNSIWRVDTSTSSISNIKVAGGATKILTIDENTFYFFKNNQVKKYRNGSVADIPAYSVHRWALSSDNELFLVSNSDYSLWKVDGASVSSYPTKSQLRGLRKIRARYGYFTNIPKDTYKRNNKKDFQGYLLILGEKKHTSNGQYIKVITSSVMKENIGDYLLDLFPKNSTITIISKNGKMYLRGSHNKNFYMRADSLDDDMLNFDTSSLNSLTYNVSGVTSPQLSVSSELCPIGTNKCYDSNSDALFCGNQESGFSSGEIPNCMTDSAICALDESTTNGKPMCEGTFSIRSTNTTIPMIPSLLNTNYYGYHNSPEINCRHIIKSLINDNINNLTILTYVKNANNKYVFKSLGTEFFNPTKDGSSLTVTDSPLTNMLNSNPKSSPSTYTKAFGAFMGLLIILFALEMLDLTYLTKCRDQLLRSQKCNYVQSVQDKIKSDCHKILYDVEEVEAQINKMEITQFKVEPASENMSKGPNVCSFYLKSYKSYSNLDTYYYSTAHDNGATSLSLIKGGHIQNRNVQGKSYGNESQLWYFESVDHFIINNSNMKVFRALIRSANGLYLEPSFGEVQGFSKTGGDNVYKVNLVRKPTKYWFIVGSKFNSNVVAELSREIESSITYSQNTSRTSYSCPSTYSKKMGNAVDGYYCCDGSVYGDNCTGTKCCLEPGLSGTCADNCCPVDVCPTDMPTMKDGRCYNSSGDSCALGTSTSEGPLCY